MLDMGFIEDIREILSKTPENKQTMLFSATMPYEIRKLIDNYLKAGYKTVKVGKELVTPKVKQEIIFVKDRERLKALESILKKYEGVPAIVFVRTKRDAAELEKELSKRGINAKAIHGDLSQRQREYVMNGFRNGKINVLVATDVAARGIDIKNVGLVVNYELPENPESYVHRIGRTGRAGKEGTAISLVAENEKRRMYKIKSLKGVRGKRFKSDSLKDLERELSSLKDVPLPQELKSLARKLLENNDPETLVAYLVSRLYG